MCGVCACVCVGCRELRGKYRHLARMVEEYDKVISTMKKEHLLRQQIEELKQYRKNGITHDRGNTHTHKHKLLSRVKVIIVTRV